MHRAALLFALVVVYAISVATASAGLITNASIIPAAGNEIHSGNGVLNLIMFNAGGGGGVNGNSAGSFNGDDANPGLPTGSNNTVAIESYITSIGELRSFYALNFPNGSGGSTVNNIVISVDLNE